jgi:hypothetical protein
VRLTNFICIVSLPCREETIRDNSRVSLLVRGGGPDTRRFVSCGDADTGRIEKPRGVPVDVLWTARRLSRGLIAYARQKPLSCHAERLPREVTWYADPFGAEIYDLRGAGRAVKRGAVRCNLRSGR